MARRNQRQSGDPRRRDFALLFIIAALSLAAGLRALQNSAGRRVRTYVAVPTVAGWIAGGLGVLAIALWILFTFPHRRFVGFMMAALLLVATGTAGHLFSRERACDTGNARDLLKQMIARTNAKPPIFIRQCVDENNAYFANWRTVVPRLSRTEHVAIVNFMDGYGLLDDDAPSPIAVTRNYEIELSHFDIETTLTVSRRH